ncbi:MAG: hypothetical protein RLZZ350_946, partial [Verrucomicrobiota bacterium]
MKPIQRLLFVLTVCTALAATSALAAEQLVLAAIPKSTGGEFWETVAGGAKKAAAELGVTLKWEGTVTETEIAEQNKIIENMVNLGVKGIALAPLNQKAMKRQVEAAVAAGIPVVIFYSNVDGNAHSSFVATDNHNGGVIGGKELARLIGDKRGAKVMCMRFVQGIALAPLNQKASRKEVENTVAAGIPVVIFDSGVDGDAQSSFIAT